MDLQYPIMVLNSNFLPQVTRYDEFIQSLFLLHAGGGRNNGKLQEWGEWPGLHYILIVLAYHLVPSAELPLN